MVNNFKAENIHFSYNTKKVLNGVSFQHESTGVVGLLGPNGAGKTTLMNILVGILTPKKGIVELNGVNILKDHKYSIKNVGYLPQNFDIYSNITGLDFLNYVCNAKGITPSYHKQEIEMVVEKFNLSSVIKSSFRKYSGGYKRRLGIAQAMIGSPKLIIVDEPTVGLDPEQRFEFRKYLSNIGDKSTILISTHIVEDIEYYCKKVLMLNNGELKFNGTPEEFINDTKGKIYEGELTIENLDLIKNKVKILNQSMKAENLVSIKAICEDYIPKGFSESIGSLEDAYVYKQTK